MAVAVCLVIWIVKVVKEKMEGNRNDVMGTIPGDTAVCSFCGREKWVGKDN